MGDVESVKGLSDIAGRNEMSGMKGGADTMKKANEMINGINSAITGLMNIINQAKSFQAPTNSLQPAQVNVDAKIEKGIEQGMTKQPQLQLIFKDLEAKKYLQETIMPLINDEIVGKELKAQLNEMPDDMILPTIHQFLRAHVVIQ